MVRRRTYISRLGITLLVVGIVGVLAAVSVLRMQSQTGRTTVVLMGEPVMVWSKDRSTKRVIRITLPKNTVIEGVHGYGMYSLESLWKLEEIEREYGAVLASSMQEALGVPIPWFIGGKGEREGTLTWGSVLEYLRGGYRTNIPLPLLVSLIIETARTDQVEEVALTPNTALTSQTLPDGTTRNVLDTSRVDILLGSLFEDESIRREGLSVAVYNTTDMATLGNRAARILGHIGVFVVRVGNDTPTIDRCTITGAKRVLATTTATIIRELFGCETVEGAAEVADIDVRVGSTYQAKFLP